MTGKITHRMSQDWFSGSGDCQGPTWPGEPPWGDGSDCGTDGRVENRVSKTRLKTLSILESPEWLGQGEARELFQRLWGNQLG